jgi:hypothetical protein
VCLQQDQALPEPMFTSFMQRQFANNNHFEGVEPVCVEKVKYLHRICIYIKMCILCLTTYTSRHTDHDTMRYVLLYAQPFLLLNCILC